MSYRLLNFIFRAIHKLSGYYHRFEDSWLTEWYCRRFASCGPGLHIYGPCNITNPSTVWIGENVHINRGAFIRAEGGLHIGDNVHIARNLTIYTINHNYQGDALPYDDTVVKKPVDIGNNVWIGINVTIIPGVSIGEGAIIGAGTVVTKDVPPLAIIGMPPTRVLKYRDKEHYDRLVRLRSFGGVSGTPYSRDA